VGTWQGSVLKLKASKGCRSGRSTRQVLRGWILPCLHVWLPFLLAACQPEHQSLPLVATSTPASPSRYLYLGINDVQGVAFAPDGALWAATTGGTVRWDLASESYIQYTQADGLTSNYVTDVAVAPDGTLWVSALGGVNHLTSEGWTGYTEADGLISDEAQAIAVTSEGTVWVGTTKGVSRFDGKSWKSYLAGVRAWDLAVAPDGDTWFANDAAGLSRYSPDTVRCIFNPPRNRVSDGI
jgi:ligand-binding sensor domain-containing protein